MTIDHQSRIEEAEIRHALLDEAPNRRVNHFIHDALVQFRINTGRGRISAHPSGIGAPVSGLPCLMILRGGKDHHIGSGCHADKTDLLTFEKFFDDQAPSCPTEALINENFVHCSQRLLMVGRDDDALAGCEPVCLKHQGEIVTFNILTRGIWVCECLPGCGGDGMTIKESLGKALGALELGGPCPGSEAGEARLLEAVDNTVYQRGFRTHHRQINPVGLGSVDQPIGIVSGDRQILKPWLQ